MKQYREDEFPMGLVLLYIGLVAAAWMYVASVNADDEEKILACAHDADCISPWKL
jgi:hypothetical protein